MIVTLGFLLLVSFIVNGVLLALSDHLKTFLPDVTVVLFSVLNPAIRFAVFALLFGVIYKVLLDAKIRWREIRSGAIFTAVLFMIGRFLIGLYVKIEPAEFAVHVEQKETEREVGTVPPKHEIGETKD